MVEFAEEIVLEWSFGVLRGFWGELGYRDWDREGFGFLEMREGVRRRLFWTGWGIGKRCLILGVRERVLVSETSAMEPMLLELLTSRIDFPMGEE